MPTIIPIRDLKDTSKISELCHMSNEPVFVTKNGYGDMVIMSQKAYDELKKDPYQIKSEETRVAENTIDYAVSENKIIYSINEIRKVLSPIFNAYNIKSAKLFGSYARGEATEKSDVDILVDSGLKGLKFFGLVNDIAQSLRVDADVYDVRELIAGSEIEKNIQKDGVLIYGEKN